MVDVYNANSVEARNILCSTPREDILTETMPCIARVEVNSAFFTTQYTGAKGVQPPVMCMNGIVRSLFIEEDDERVFPCNEKELKMMSEEQVAIEYALSPEEISTMALKGMFHDPDFEVPATLVGNMIEIPLNITYQGIYDTPCCFVEIISPLELTTSTQYNSYYGLFETCPESPVIQQMKEQKFDFSHLNEKRTIFTPEEDIPYEREEEMEEQQEMLTDDQREDEDIMAHVSEKMAAEARDLENRAASVDPVRVAQEVLYPAQQAFDEQEASQKLQEDNSYKLYSYGTENDQQDGPIKVGPSGRSRTSSIYDILRQQAKVDEAPADAEAGVQYEEQEGQEQPTDEAEGFMDFESEESLDDGSGKSQKQKAAAAAKKQQQINRRIDIGEDLKAMNEGRTDIAGFGAAEEPKAEPAGTNPVANKLLAAIQARRQQQATEVQNESVASPAAKDEKQAQGGGQFL